MQFSFRCHVLVPTLTPFLQSSGTFDDSRSSKYEVHHGIVRSQSQVVQSGGQSSRHSNPVCVGARRPSVYVIDAGGLLALLLLLNVRADHVQ